MISWNHVFAMAAFGAAFFAGMLAVGDFAAAARWWGMEMLGGIGAEAHLWRGVVFACVSALLGLGGARLWPRRDHR